MNSRKKWVIERMLRKRGVTKQYTLEQMEISRVTLLSYLRNPMKMNGYQRQALAQILGIKIELINRVCDSRQTMGLSEIQKIIDKIQTQTNYEKG